MHKRLNKYEYLSESEAKTFMKVMIRELVYIAERCGMPQAVPDLMAAEFILLTGSQKERPLARPQRARLK